MKSTPSSTARRNTRIASARSAGSPQIPGPVMRIAPYPSRVIATLPPRENTPLAAAASSPSAMQLTSMQLNLPSRREHEPNQGFLRALHMLAVAAAAIGENDEAARCREFLRDSSPTAAAALETT